MSDYEVLQEMVDALPATISNLSSGINNLNTSIDGLTDEKNAVEWSMSLMTTAAEVWMSEKADEFNPGTHDPPIECSASAYGDFSISNLTDWVILSGGAYVYVWTDVISASPPTLPETQQYNRQIGFSESYDHIHKTNDLGGTYGIDAKKSGLNTGLGLMEDNRDKYVAVLKVYDRVLREK